ncbi:MAG: N-acetyltransferase [Brevundimonas sp.]|nr:MAG: N-acetyltransferase [Brevundimonas sp.]
MSADPDLLALWTRGWAATRGAPAPVRDGVAWRIDVGQPDQFARYIFADVGPAVRDRAERIDRPWTFLKVCAHETAVRSQLPPMWEMRPPGFMMTLAGEMGGDAPAPEGLRFEIGTGGPVTFCRLLDGDDVEAARGRAVVIDGLTVFDRIATSPDWRRRGLASRIMRRLERLMREAGGRDGVLVATAEGRALYERLGWLLHSPYSTAVIPGPVDV